MELRGPANENVYIGAETREGGNYQALPFWHQSEDRAEDFDVEHLSDFARKSKLTAFSDEEIERTMGACIDEWRAGDLTFRLISPVQSIPDPELAREDEMREALIPAIHAELTLDNRSGESSRKVFFGYAGSDRSYGMRTISEDGLVGIGQHSTTAIATDDPSVYAGIAFQTERILEPDSGENLPFLVGNLGLLVGEVAAGEVRTFRFVIGFFRSGIATTGIQTRYLYNRYFVNLEHVLHAGLSLHDERKAAAEKLDNAIRGRLSAERAWMLAHAIRSYYGSTQLLEPITGEVIWVVNEGEYRMMNTFDLIVDQAFFELALNPWTVRNELDHYASRYSYSDGARLPGDPTVHPGGIAFTHDMGVANVFSRPGFSGYEQSHIRGCFSYMSSEELMNWVLTAALYLKSTNDLDWLRDHKSTLSNALVSMENRDHPDANQRNGLVGLDGDRCQGGAEITTYDSLDASLGQARNNLYLGVKAWATYVALVNLFEHLGEAELIARASAQAGRAKTTIIESADENGLLPAVIGEGVEARIIPAIEALVYPFLLGLELDPSLKECLAKHFAGVLVNGVCLFEDGGWKLSSTSQNSWLSKIYLCQFVSEEILGFPPDHLADTVHLAWLTDPQNAYFAWSDQMLAGKAVGSRYYPRGITSALWLGKDLSEIRQELSFKD